MPHTTVNPYQHLPQEIQDLPHWTTHKNKRPSTPPNKWVEGHTLHTLLSDPNSNNSPHNLGILVAPHPTPYLYLDVDCPLPKEEKQALTALIRAKIEEDPTNTFMGSDEHNTLIHDTWQSITDTEIASLTAQTYTEYSPSLTGLRLIVLATDKQNYTKALAKSRNSALNGQVDFGNQFITITGYKLPTSPSTIHALALEELPSFGFKPKANKEDNSDLSMDEEVDGLWASDLPSPDVIIDALNSIRLSPHPSNSKVHTEWFNLTNQTYEHYHFWLTIGMALHNYAQEARSNTAIFSAYLQWSETDKETFSSEEDVNTKWQSFADTPTPTDITWRTLLKLANRCKFTYPRPVILKGKSTGRPMVNEMVNFDYLLEFHSLKLMRADGLYVTGDAEVLRKYFTRISGVQVWPYKGQIMVGPFPAERPYDELSAAVLTMCQDSNWRGLASAQSLVKHWVSHNSEEVDIVTAWLDTPWDKMPDHLRYDARGVDLATYDQYSTMDTILECLNFDDTAKPEVQLIYTSMVRKWFLQFAKFRDAHTVPLELQDNGGMLILVGAEATYKTTFGKMLLPSYFARHRKSENLNLSGDKGMRDFARNLGTKVIVQIDEFEGLMDMQKEGSKFKNIISTNDMGITDIYRTSDKPMRRTAVLLGTTNETRQILSDNGSRRMWFVKVNQIDTMRLRKFNWHTFYNVMREELAHELNMFEQGFQKHVPWMLTKDELVTLNQANKGLAAKSELSMILEEIWPAYEPCKDIWKELTAWYGKKGNTMQGTNAEANKRAVITGERRWAKRIHVEAAIREYMPHMGKIHAPTLERALERHCGEWSGTMNRSLTLPNPMGAIMYKGKITPPNERYAGYFLPPMSEEYAQIPESQDVPEEEMS